VECGVWNRHLLLEVTKNLPALLEWARAIGLKPLVLLLNSVEVLSDLLRATLVSVDDILDETDLAVERVTVRLSWLWAELSELSLRIVEGRDLLARLTLLALTTLAAFAFAAFATFTRLAFTLWATRFTLFAFAALAGGCDCSRFLSHY